MADKVVKDYRNPAQRRYIYQPYWISSLEVKALELGSDETKCGLVFSFPAVKYGGGSPLISVLQVCCQVTQAFTGGTITVDVGSYTLTTDIVTDGGAMTIVDADEYIASATITNGTAGAYFAAAASSDWLTSRLLWTEAAAATISPADATVPAVGAYVTSDGTMTAGKLRVHMLICEVPLV
jgi:hypothetical protein